MVEEFSTSAERESLQELNVHVTVQITNQLKKPAANSRNQTTNSGSFRNPKRA